MMQLQQVLLELLVFQQQRLEFPQQVRLEQEGELG